MNKEEKIKEAYISEFTNKEQDFDDRFEFLKPYIDEYGWLCGKLHDVDMNKFDVSGHEIRPKSLSGIENNNGWIKIESEEDLPDFGGDYYIFNGKVEIYTYLKDNRWLSPYNSYPKSTGLHGITHYKKMEVPQPPIY